MVESARTLSSAWSMRDTSWAITPTITLICPPSAINLPSRRSWSHWKRCFWRPPARRCPSSTVRLRENTARKICARPMALGYTTVFWSLAYVDWYTDNQPSEQEAYSKLLPRIHDGAIVLLHSTSQTNAQILDELLTPLGRNGLHLRLSGRPPCFVKRRACTFGCGLLSNQRPGLLRDRALYPILPRPGEQRHPGRSGLPPPECRSRRWPPDCPWCPPEHPAYG